MFHSPIPSIWRKLFFCPCSIARALPHHVIAECLCYHCNLAARPRQVSKRIRPYERNCGTVEPPCNATTPPLIRPKSGGDEQVQISQSLPTVEIPSFASM